MHKKIGRRALLCSVLWLLASSAQASVEIFEISFAGKTYWMAQIIGPNEGLLLEQVLAREVTEVVKEEYGSRSVAEISGEYDFGINKILNIVIEKPATIAPQTTAMQYFTRNAILGTIEFNFQTVQNMADLPQFKRISAWEDGTDTSEIIERFQAGGPKSGSAVEVKRLVVKRSREHKFVGLVMMHSAIHTSLSEGAVHTMEMPEFFPVQQIMAETKPGARVRIYRSLGMQEVVQLEHDPDFSDGRGLSLLSASHEGVANQLKTHLSRLSGGGQPTLEQLPVGMNFFPEISINNLAAQSCERLGQYIRFFREEPALIP